MGKIDLIITNAAQLVTCASEGKAKKGAEMQELGIIENGAVAVNKGEIVGIGPTKEVMWEFDSENIIDATGQVVCPGFIDPHTHIVFAGDRLNEFELRIRGASYLEIMEAGGGIVGTVSHTRRASIQELVDSAIERLNVMLELGTTTVEIKTGYGLDWETEAKMLLVIAELDKSHEIDIIPTFLAAHAIPPEWKEKEDEFTSLICNEMIPAAWRWYVNSHFAEKGTQFFIDVFCEQSAFNLEQSQQVIVSAKELGFSIKAHVDEFTNLGCAEYAIEQGATSIDHLDATSENEIKMLAKSETVGIVTPTVNFNLGSNKFANAKKMIDSGCAIALSTDYNPGSAPCPSQLLTMAIACRYQRLLPSEAFNAITINAAFAVGMGNTRGSIEVGKRADVLILETDDYRQVAYEFGRNFVRNVVSRGKILEI